MRKATLTIAALALLAAPAFAQGPRPGRGPNVANMVARQVKHLTTLLDLSPGQQNQLTTLLTDSFNTNQPLMKSRFDAEKALRTAENNNDAAGIQSAHTQLATIDSQLAANRAAFNSGLGGILSTDQMNKYKALGPQGGFGGRGGGRGFRRGPGPGGPGGPGGPAA